MSTRHLSTAGAVLAFGFAASVALAGLPEAAPQIRRDHPRLFFNADTWPAIKANALGRALPDLERLLRRCDAFPTNPVCSRTEAAAPGWSRSVPLPPVVEWGSQAAMCALAWRFTGDGAYLEKARRMLEVSVAAYGEALRNCRAVNWYSTTRILALCAYDWIFEALTPDERRAIIVPLVRHVDEVQASRGGPKVVRRNSSGPETGFYGVESLLWYSGVAAVGDGFCDDMARRHLEDGYGRFLKMLAYRDRVAGDDGALAAGVVGYSMGAYPWAHFNFFHTMLSAAGVDVADLYPNLALFPGWIWWNWIPTRHGAGGFGFGDTTHGDNLLPLSGGFYEHMTQYAHFYRRSSPDAARLALSLREMVPSRSIGDTWPMYPFILSEADGVSPFSAAELSAAPLKARHFESVGQFVMRSGWDVGSTFCMFTSGGDVVNHRHFDENNFVIYRGGYQALDSGCRARQTDFNLTHYYSQTVAHNCVLVHRRPEEPLTPYWGLKFNGPEGASGYGGQIRKCATPVAFETNDAFTYVASDATKSYGGKCREAVRQFVYLMPDVFVVYDRVCAANMAYAKEWLLHTQNEPEVDGTLVRARAEDGAICSRTLLPSRAAVVKVGGEGREFWSSGRNWELDADYVRFARAMCEKAGTGPWFGRWRVEVRPATAAADDRFLHVINVGDAESCVPVACEYVRRASTDGVRISVPGQRLKGAEGTLEAEIEFNRKGAVGGKFRLRLLDGKGRCLASESGKLAESVAAQSGVGVR